MGRETGREKLEFENLPAKRGYFWHLVTLDFKWQISNMRNCMKNWFSTLQFANEIGIFRPSVCEIHYEASK